MKPCKHDKHCGGCDYSGLSYEEQLARKQQYINSLFGDWVKPEKILKAKDPTHYRNKVHGVLYSDAHGNVFSGIYEAGTHRVEPVSDCLIENETAQKIIADTVKLMKSFRFRIYNERTGSGSFKHILVRVGEETGEVLLILVSADSLIPSKNNFVKAIRAQHPEITSIVLNVNPRDTTMVLGDRNIPLYGPGFILDRLMGITYRLSPNSFYQVNHAQTRVLYEKAYEYAALTGKETVIDAYCGIGTIGMGLAGQAGHVYGVELNKDAVRDAELTAKHNKITNVTFENADASAYMTALAREAKSVDVVMMDPPRSGSTQEFLDALITLGPSRIVYISCGPDTQKRDVDYLQKHSNYRMVKCCPVDLFPMTVHCETVVLLTSKVNRMII